MKLTGGRRMTGFSLVLLVTGGFVVLAMLVLAPDYAQARLDGSQPVSLRSGLQANYSMDPLDLVVPPVNIKVVEQAIIDHTVSNSLPPEQQAATAISILQTPVYTITPTPAQTRPAAASPTGTGQSTTKNAPAFTPTGMTGSTKIIPPAPSAAVLTESPTAMLTQTASPTLPVVATPPNSSQTPTASATHTPRPTWTMVPTPFGTTATPSPIPTLTPKPTLTATGTPPPATAAVTPTFTPTRPAATVLPPTPTQPAATVQPPTPTSTYTPTFTFTPTWTFTATFTATATRTNTATYTVTPRPPTATFTPTPGSYPPPATSTHVPTIPPYP